MRVSEGRGCLQTMPSVSILEQTQSGQTSRARCARKIIKVHKVINAINLTGIFFDTRDKKVEIGLVLLRCFIIL